MTSSGFAAVVLVLVPLWISVEPNDNDDDAAPRSMLVGRAQNLLEFQPICGVFHKRFGGARIRFGGESLLLSARKAAGIE